MTNRTTVSFRVKDKGGPSGGHSLSKSVPAFDWEGFKRTPNAEEFVKKAYFAAVKKIMREVEESKNGTVESDLDSVEAVIARALSFTKDDIRDWIKTRDWSKASQVRDISKVLPEIEKHLPDLATRRNPFSTEVSAKIADKIIAAVADDPDPIAEFLFTALTTQRSQDPELLPL
ncbi:MAG: hypothetical protein B7X93_09885 [Hydrogenophilales bacterium 17-61-9]|nr:MAG: hypothetical protein B7X93_09885 [Hydrogenophilales bacterium 17-61-9]